MSLSLENKKLAELAIISAVASLAATGVTAMGTIAAGKAKQQAAEYEAAQLDVKAKEELAASQRDAEELRRKKDLTLSTLQANSAASGFSATDPTTLALADEISRYGTVQEQMAMYGGVSRSEGIEAQAAGRRMEGAAARRGATYEAIGTGLAQLGRIGGGEKASGTILGDISSMARKYGTATPASSKSGLTYG